MIIFNKKQIIHHNNKQTTIPIYKPNRAGPHLGVNFQILLTTLLSVNQVRLKESAKTLTETLACQLQ